MSGHMWTLSSQVGPEDSEGGGESGRLAGVEAGKGQAMQASQLVPVFGAYPEMGGGQGRVGGTEESVRRVEPAGMCSKIWLWLLPQCRRHLWIPGYLRGGISGAG